METLDDGGEIRGRQGARRPGKRINFHLPNANTVFLLGIIAIPTVLTYWLGIVLAIMALVRYKKDLPVYHSDPNKYAKSYQKLRKGMIMAWVAIGLGALLILLIFALIIGDAF